MKNLLFLFLAFLSGCNSHAQNSPTNAAAKQPVSANVDNTYPMPEGKKAVLKLPFGRTITIHAWERAELQLITKIQTTSEELKNLHTMDVDDNAEQLKITTNYRKDEMEKQYSCCWCAQCDSILAGAKQKASKWEQNCICLRVDYEVMLPAGTSLSIETISGDIEIKGLTGELRAKTISGFVDIDRPIKNAATINFHSVTGEIYTDFDIPLSKNSTAYDKKVATSLNGGGTKISAESVSGDIYFRKRSQD
jgi:hypothetical protein